MNITSTITAFAGKDAGSLVELISGVVGFLQSMPSFILTSLFYISTVMVWGITHLHIVFAVVEIFVIGLTVTTSGKNAANIIKNFFVYHIAVFRAFIGFVFALIDMATQIIIALTTWIP